MEHWKQPAGQAVGTGEVDGVRLAVMLWRRKVRIAFGTSAVTIAGVVYAMTATPVYRSQAIIGLKEAGKSGNPSQIFSQFGGVGGIMASQLGLGNTNLAKVEILLQGHEMAEAVLSRDSLFARLFPDPAKRLPLRKALELLRRKILKLEPDNKANVITVAIEFSDPELSKRLVDGYLAELNKRIRDDVIRDAEVNREYLGRQLSNTGDPILREKILGMIGMEMEKSMLVSTQAFEVLEKPMIPIYKIGPNRKIIITMAFILGFALSILGIAAANGWTAFKAAARELAGT